MKRLRRLALFLLIGLSLYLAPWLVVHVFIAPEQKSLASLEKADAVLVFGALVRNQTISPLQKERLLAAKRLLDEGKVAQIVVSNNPLAAKVMAKYLREHGVPDQQLVIDPKADKTPDTCRSEYALHQDSRKLVFLSQGYHLTRIHYQCSRIGVTGQLFAAEQLGIIDRSQSPWYTKARVRAYRYLREAGLTWLVLVGYYR